MLRPISGLSIKLTESTSECNVSSLVSPGAAGSSPSEVLADGAPKNCSLRRDSGTGLTMNLRPAECTTWAVVLGEMPAGKGQDKRSEVCVCV